MWIRTQDRMRLIDAKDFLVTPTLSEYKILIKSWDEKISVIGSYKTLERVIEILDDIQECINDIGARSFYGTERARHCNTVYVMPKD